MSVLSLEPIGTVSSSPRRPQGLSARGAFSSSLFSRSISDPASSNFAWSSMRWPSAFWSSDLRLAAFCSSSATCAFACSACLLGALKFALRCFQTRLRLRKPGLD